MLNQTKLKAFAELLERQQIEDLRGRKLDCAVNVKNRRVSIVPGRKYTKIDVGGSGKYMVDNQTSEIFGIKGYGVIHRGHQYGTLDTTALFCWGDYYARRLPEPVTP